MEQDRCAEVDSDEIAEGKRLMKAAALAVFKTAGNIESVTRSNAVEAARTARQKFVAGRDSCYLPVALYDAELGAAHAALREWRIAS